MRKKIKKANKGIDVDPSLGLKLKNNKLLQNVQNQLFSPIEEDIEPVVDDYIPKNNNNSPMSMKDKMGIFRRDVTNMDYDLQRIQNSLNTPIPASAKKPISAKKPFNFSTSDVQNTFNIAGALFANSLDQPINTNKRKVSEDLSFNSNPYGAFLTPQQGIGQTAIAKNGKSIPTNTNQLVVENDNYKPLSPTTFEITGPSHKDGGTLLQNGSNLVEVQGKEPLIQTEDGTAHIFGAKPILLDINNKNKPVRTNKTYQSLARTIGRKEGTLNKEFNNITDRIIDNPQDQFDTISNNTSEIMLKSTNKKLNSLRQEQVQLAKIQEIDNELFPTKPLKAKYGKSIPKASGGDKLETSFNDIDWLKNPTISNIYGYKGDKFSGVKNATVYSDEDWQGLANKLGFKGGSNKDFQKFLYDLDPTSVQKIHDDFDKKNKTKMTSSTLFDNKIGARWDNIYNHFNTSYLPKIQKNTNSDLKINQSNFFDGEAYSKAFKSATDKLPKGTPTDDSIPGNIKKSSYTKQRYNMKNDVSEIASLLYNPDVVVKNRLSPNFIDSPNISLQNERNQISSNLNSLIQANSDNPAVQSYLAAQSLQAMQSPNEREFNINLQLQDQARKENVNELRRIQGYNNEVDYENSINKASRNFNKFALGRAALSSMGLKRLQNDKTQNDLKAFYDNLTPQYFSDKENIIQFAGNPNAALEEALPSLFKGKTKTYTRDEKGKVIEEKTKQTGKYGASITKMMKTIR